MDELKASPSKLSQLGTSLRRGMGRAINEGFVHDMLNISNILRGLPEVPSQYDRHRSVMRREVPEAPEAIGRSIGRYLSDPENLANLIADPSNLVGLKTLKSLKPAVRALTSPLGALAAGTAYASDADAGPLSRLARHLAADSEPVRRGIANIIKDRGGNWIDGNLNRGLKQLKLTGDRYGELNDWIDGPLRKYIMRDMASEADPIRKLAETHPIHTSAVDQPALRELNDNIGLEKLGQSDRARNWEDWADEEIFPTRAADLKSDESSVRKYPWVSKLGDEEKVWSLSSNSMDALQFRHMVDEIANGLQSGEISPESLKNGSFSVEAAARYVGAKNEAARKAAEKATLEETRRNLMNQSFKEYENGYRWVELGDTSDPEARKVCTSLGKQGGWCTQKDWAAEEYGSKGSKLYTLLDPNGKPHVQVQTSMNRSLTDFEGEFESLLDDLSGETYQNFTEIAETQGDVEAMKFLAKHGGDQASSKAQKILDQMSLGKPSILQIKPMSNDWDSRMVWDQIAKNPNYKKNLLPMVQDFVKSGEWGSVQDLKNTGLRLMNGKYVDPVNDKVYQMTPDAGGSFPSEISDRFFKPHEARELGFDTYQPHSVRDLYEFAQQNRDKLRELKLKSVEDFYSAPENARYSSKPQYRERDLQAVTDDLLRLEDDFDTWWKSLGSN